MASHTITFNLNDFMYDSLLAEQNRRKKTTVSADVFAKEMICELLSPEGYPVKK